MPDSFTQPEKPGNFKETIHNDARRIASHLQELNNELAAALLPPIYTGKNHASDEERYQFTRNHLIAVGELADKISSQIRESLVRYK